MVAQRRDVWVEATQYGMVQGGRCGGGRLVDGTPGPLGGSVADVGAAFSLHAGLRCRLEVCPPCGRRHGHYPISRRCAFGVVVWTSCLLRPCARDARLVVVSTGNTVPWERCRVTDNLHVKKCAGGTIRTQEGAGAASDWLDRPCGRLVLSTHYIVAALMFYSYARPKQDNSHDK